MAGPASDLAPVLVGPVFGLGGALIGLLGGWLTAQYADRAAARSWVRDIGKATREWERARDDTKANLTVQLIQELATNLASAAHAMTWLTWLARFDPDYLNERHINEYDAAMREIQPKIIGAVAALGAISPDAADAAADTVAEAFRVDGIIAMHCVEYRGGKVAPLASANDDSLELLNGLVGSMRGVSGRILEARQHRNKE